MTVKITSHTISTWCRSSRHISRFCSTW